MVKAKKLNEELIAGLETGDKLVCRKKVTYFGEKCFRKGGVYTVNSVQYDNMLIVYDELGEMFTINGTRDYSKHFLIYDGRAKDLEKGDKIFLTSKIKGQYSDRFTKGKVYEVYRVNSLGEAVVWNDKGNLFALNGEEDLSEYFVKVK